MPSLQPTDEEQACNSLTRLAVAKETKNRVFIDNSRNDTDAKGSKISERR